MASNVSERGRANRAVVRSRTNGKACYTCHRRKVRCDILTHGTPCSNCKAQDTPDCHIYVRHSPRRPAARPSSSVSHRSSPRAATSTPATQSPLSTATISIPTPADHDQERQSGTRSGDTSTPASREDAPNPSQSDEPVNHLSEFLSHDEARGREISFANRLYYIGTEFSTLNHLVQQRSQPSEKGILHFGSQPHAPRLPEVPADSLRLPGKKLTKELIDAYFTLVNSGFPIVHEEAFMASYNNRSEANPLSLLVLNCILLTGAHALSPTKPEMAKLTSIFYRRARQLFDARYDPAREHYIQAALLFTWYCDTLEDVVSNSWHWVGVASRTAFGIGQHRDASNSRLNESIKLHWVRLWWVLYQFDVMVAAAQGRVQSIDLDQSDVVALEGKHFPGSGVSSGFVIQHTQVCMILSRAMKSVTRLRSTSADRAAATEQADTELASFYMNLPNALQASSYEKVDVWVCMLHLSYYYSLLLLHRPSPVPGEREHTVEDGRICSDAVSKITAIFDALRTREMLGSLWIPSIYVLLATLVHVCTQLQSPNPIVAASSRRLFSQLTETLQALTVKWLCCRSWLLIFQRGLSQGLGMQRGNSNLNESGASTNANANEGDGPISINTAQGSNVSFEMSNGSSNSDIGPRPWWMQSQGHELVQFLPPPPLSGNTSLDPASSGVLGSAYQLQPDQFTNSQLDFELLLAGLGTGDDAAHDFSGV